MFYEFRSRKEARWALKLAKSAGTGNKPQS